MEQCVSCSSIQLIPTSLLSLPSTRISGNSPPWDPQRGSETNCWAGSTSPSLGNITFLLSSSFLMPLGFCLEFCGSSCLSEPVFYFSISLALCATSWAISSGRSFSSLILPSAMSSLLCGSSNLGLRLLDGAHMCPVWFWRHCWSPLYTGNRKVLWKPDLVTGERTCLPGYFRKILWWLSRRWPRDIWGYWGNASLTEWVRKCSFSCMFW